MNFIIGVILIYFVYAIAKYISKGLFDKKWHRETQDRIDSIKHERAFWNLMSKKFEVMYPCIDDIVVNYFNYKADMNRGGGVYDKKITDNDILDKRIINRRNDAITNVNLLIAELDRREKIINDLLKEENFTFDKTEILKEFESFNEKHLSLDEKKGRMFIKLFLNGETTWNGFDTTTKGGIANDKKVSGGDIFSARKDFETNTIHLEYDETGNNQIEPRALLGLIMEKIEISKFFVELFCKKVKNEEKLKQALENWERLNMLRWCVSDFSTAHLGLNGIQWAMLKLFEVVLL